MGAPVALAKLVADQCIGCDRVRHAQVGLGQSKQGGAFVAGQAVLLEKTVDPSRSTGFAQGGEQAGSDCIDVGALGPGEPRLISERFQRPGLWNAIERRDGAPCDFECVGQGFGAFRAREVTDVLILSRFC